MKIIGFILLFLVTVGIGVYFGGNIISFFSQDFIENVSKIESIEPLGDLVTIAVDFEKKINTPPPIRMEVQAPQSLLTQNGVFIWTNIQRATYGAPSLNPNMKLNEAAQIKLQDMFENQYFMHESLLGVGPGELANAVNYEFIMVGENLALGNFENDQALLQAWMDSPGHRANILNEKYAEIGIAVGKGIFEGQSTWLAVQEFGLSITACPQPDESLFAQIQSDETHINNLEKMLILKRGELRNFRPKHSKAYNQKANEYNILVGEYNVLIEKIEILVATHNSQIQLFNQCAQPVS